MYANGCIQNMIVLTTLIELLFLLWEKSSHRKILFSLSPSQFIVFIHFISCFRPFAWRSLQMQNETIDLLFTLLLHRLACESCCLNMSHSRGRTNLFSERSSFYFLFSCRFQTTAFFKAKQILQLRQFDKEKIFIVYELHAMAIIPM